MASRETKKGEAGSSNEATDQTTCPKASKVRSFMAAKRTVVQYYGSSNASCGYCKREVRPDDEFTGRSSYDMQADSITAQDYQELLDRGWRRCGDYCYHPINSRTCCPNYAINCDAIEFKLSRSQRRCIKNLNSFLIGHREGEEKVELDYSSSERPFINHIEHSKLLDKLKVSTKARDKRFLKNIERKVKLNQAQPDEVVRRMQEKKLGRTVLHAASLEDHLFPQKARLVKGTLRPKHKLRLELLHVDSERAISMRLDENKVIQMYQEAIHKEDSSQWSMSRYHDFLIESPIITEEIKNFHHVAANDKCDTLATQATNSDNQYLLVKPSSLPTSYGSYHCCYLLDDKLIAVGVLDVLPRCITTVYFFYDPAYGHLNLGIYSALVEISMIRQMAKQYSGPPNTNQLTKYYLGYYVHECKKMRYKTTFKPSYLLCSETFQYVPTERCLQKLAGQKYARFCDDPNNNYNVHTDVSTFKHILNIPVITPVTETSRIMDYFKWLEKNFGEGTTDLVVNYFLIQYSRLIGNKLLVTMYLKLNAIHRALEHRYRETKDSSQSNDPTTKPESKMDVEE